jgi:hypothetical protein
MDFVYVGNYSDIANVGVVERFGTPINLTLEQAHRAVADGVPLLPREQFDEIGFAPDELRLYGFPGPREFAAAAFRAKHSEALAKAAAFTAEVMNTIAGIAPLEGE